MHKNLCSIKLFLWGVLMLGFLTGNTQQPTGVIEVSGRIIQRGNIPENWSGNLQLFISDYGTVPLEDGGQFEFKAPRGLDLHIEILPTDFQIIRPLDGLLQGESVNYDIEIYVIHGTQDSVLKQQIQNLDEEIKALQDKQQLSENQIDKLDQIILDTVFFFQQKQHDFRNRISQLNNQLESAEAENSMLKDSLQQYRSQLHILEDSVEVLINKLVIALEERYLRQKAHFDDFSRLLLNYQTRLKDLRDWLPQLENCYRHQDALSQFNEVCIAYGEARNELFEDHETHVGGIRHYWEDPAGVLKAEEVCQIALSEIHDDLILKELNGEIMPYLKDFASKGIRKVNQTRKAGEHLKEQLDPAIERFDNALDDLFTILSKEI